MRILMLENHLVFATTVVEQFLNEHEVDVCASLREGMDLASTDTFQIVLVDYDLDDGKGDEFVRWLRSSGFRGRVIAISAKEDGNRALIRAGADDACRKSDFAEIEGLLQRR